MERGYRKRRTNRQIPEDEVITLENVTKSYSTGAPALNGVTLHIKRGEFVFIVGDSGSGKSTLIKLLLRELVPTDGEITVLGYNLRRIKHSKIPKFRRNLGIVFQDFRNVPSILATVNLAGKYKNKINQLSGGEQQRVALARALVNKPTILLADEPTGNLDPNNSWEIMKLMEQINENGTTVIVVTHNREIVNAMKKRVITMKKGVIIEDEEEGMYIDEE